MPGFTIVQDTVKEAGVQSPFCICLEECLKNNQFGWKILRQKFNRKIQKITKINHFLFPTHSWLWICIEWLCCCKPHKHVRVGLPWACSWVLHGHACEVTHEHVCMELPWACSWELQVHADGISHVHVRVSYSCACRWGSPQPCIFSFFGNFSFSCRY